MEPFFAPCPRGLEGALSAELAEIGAEEIAAVEGGVAFRGNYLLCYKANLESRIASRVLWHVAEGSYASENDIYQLAHDLDWARWFDPACTIRVDVSAIRCPLKSLDFVTLKIKDAICDKFRAATGARPSVETRNPDARIHAHLDPRKITLYLDTSGKPLFKRGWRAEGGEAPLRENLAAGILNLSGWKAGIPLLDPMCGSGTFLIEAAQVALGIAPGINRSFAFEKLKNFDERAWHELREQSIARQKPRQRLEIFGSDLYGRALKNARENLARMDLEACVQLKQANALELSPPAQEGVLVTNPPYGVRSGELDELASFYPQLGNVLKQRFAGWRAYLFTADLRLPKLIGLSASRRILLYNGALECRLYEYKIVEGSNRQQR
ncbi:MAG: THUMP domain-containing class I SAM-dependent RNA methyltransferase [Burkholderiales bacterium]